jgi:hypothetical protein
VGGEVQGVGTRFFLRNTKPWKPRSSSRTTAEKTANRPWSCFKKPKPIPENLDIWRERLPAEQARFAHRHGSAAVKRSCQRQCPPLFAVASRRIAEGPKRISMKARKAERRSHPWQRADHNFAVISVALLTLFLLIGVGAWIFGDSSTASVRASPPASQMNAARS